ncbi:hypothetical protein EV360DRAFT_88225 [Lentinula raphanica]|nr:hypothetical protein EV360DRAFT_88225 [Lentinula raphanica]
MIIFVPANCMAGMHQPADGGLQRPIKYWLKSSLFSDWIVDKHQKQLAQGLKSEDIKITTSYPKLHDASVAGLIEAYKFMKSLDGQDLIRKAWTKCAMEKGYNLSAECLTSAQSITALNHYLQSDATLHSEIEQQCGQVLGVNDESVVEADTDIHAAVEDDVDIPFTAVIRGAHECTLKCTCHS